MCALVRSRSRRPLTAKRPHHKFLVIIWKIIDPGTNEICPSVFFFQWMHLFRTKWLTAPSNNQWMIFTHTTRASWLLHLLTRKLTRCSFHQFQFSLTIYLLPTGHLSTRCNEHGTLISHVASPSGRAPSPLQLHCVSLLSPPLPWLSRQALVSSSEVAAVLVVDWPCLCASLCLPFLFVDRLHYNQTPLYLFPPHLHVKEKARFVGFIRPSTVWSGAQNINWVPQ